MPTSHPPSVSTGVAQPLEVILKCAAPVPLRVALATVSGETPVLPTVTKSGTDDVATFWLPNGTLVGLTVPEDRLEPFRLTVRGVPAVLSAMLSVAADDAPARGSKETSIVHDRPGATPGSSTVPAVVQFSCSTVKSAALAPPSVTPLTTALPAPVLVYRTVFVIGVPLGTLP